MIGKDMKGIGHGLFQGTTPFLHRKS